MFSQNPINVVWFDGNAFNFQSFTEQQKAEAITFAAEKIAAGNDVALYECDLVISTN